MMANCARVPAVRQRREKSPRAVTPLEHGKLSMRPFLIRIDSRRESPIRKLFTKPPCAPPRTAASLSPCLFPCVSPKLGEGVRMAIAEPTESAAPVASEEAGGGYGAVSGRQSHAGMTRRAAVCLGALVATCLFLAITDANAQQLPAALLSGVGRWGGSFVGPSFAPTPPAQSALPSTGILLMPVTLHELPVKALHEISVLVGPAGDATRNGQSRRLKTPWTRR